VPCHGRFVTLFLYRCPSNLSPKFISPKMPFSATLCCGAEPGNFHTTPSSPMSSPFPLSLLNDRVYPFPFLLYIVDIPFSLLPYSSKGVPPLKTPRSRKKRLQPSYAYTMPSRASRSWLLCLLIPPHQQHKQHNTNAWGTQITKRR